ncbi:hypothetical protein ABID19_000723 [Mesorhizobium robiniae]|uniref:Uncharacterized protein n=1 Tax=Mesorhizobium robiniae TaxID=559315 RepID=A0ABV2GHD5_9HYPH
MQSTEVIPSRPLLEFEGNTHRAGPFPARLDDLV